MPTQGLIPAAEDVTATSADAPPDAQQRGDALLRNFRQVASSNAADFTAAPGAVTTLRVSVTHASLEHAAYPVAVGHYNSDLITGPEAALDWRMDEKLSKRRAMNLYPGKVGEAEVILLPHKAPPGALVIGLGEIGELTTDVVTRGITEAALRLALAIVETSTTSATSEPPAPPSTPQPRRSAAFSALLIGVRGGRALTIENSVAAIVTGALQANRVLAAQKLLGQVCVDAVEFIEIYEEYAIRAAHAVRNLNQYLRLPLAEDEGLALEQYLHRGEGGFAGQPANEYEEGWWRRLQISEKKDAVGRGTGELEFLLLTDRARAELTLQATQRALVEQLVAETINSANAASDLTLPSTLYELLLPNNLKNQPLDTSDILLIVDSQSAQYPWEMLADRKPGEQTITSSQQLRPLSVRRGVVRQLTTREYRPLVQPAREKKALVIGDPWLDPTRHPEDAAYPALPGAVAEAEAVATLLKARGYAVTALIQADALYHYQSALWRRLPDYPHRRPRHLQASITGPERRGIGGQSLSDRGGNRPVARRARNGLSQLLLCGHNRCRSDATGEPAATDAAGVESVSRQRCPRIDQNWGARRGGRRLGRPRCRRAGLCGTVICIYAARADGVRAGQLPLW